MVFLQGPGQRDAPTNSTHLRDIYKQGRGDPVRSGQQKAWGTKHTHSKAFKTDCIPLQTCTAFYQALSPHC